MVLSQLIPPISPIVFIIFSYYYKNSPFSIPETKNRLHDTEFFFHHGPIKNIFQKGYANINNLHSKFRVIGVELQAESKWNSRKL
jgi:hypothetical protein